MEDDKGLREGMALALKREEFSFTLCGTLGEAEKLLMGNQDFALILLDLNLPDGSGYEFLKKIKSRSSVPVIIVTANDMELDEVRGLELGAEDYIVKPFSLMVLRARIDKALKNLGKDERKVYQFGDLSFSFADMKFFRGKEEIILSRTEQRLLWLLVENRNIVLTRDQLLDRIWTDGGEYVDENALSVAVGRLRAKLHESSDGHLQTVYGKGYVWRCVEKCEEAL